MENKRKQMEKEKLSLYMYILYFKNEKAKTSIMPKHQMGRIYCSTQYGESIHGPESFPHFPKTKHSFRILGHRWHVAKAIESLGDHMGKMTFWILCVMQSNNIAAINIAYYTTDARVDRNN